MIFNKIKKSNLRQKKKHKEETKKNLKKRGRP